MTSAWTNKEIETILVQLDEAVLPFKNYCFTGIGQGLNLLGTGGFSNVYEAELRKDHNRSFAIKVIGFGDKSVAPAEFKEEVGAQKRLCFSQENTVRILEAVEIHVWFDDELRVLKAETADAGAEKEQNISGTTKIQGQDYLTLQFIVMEKLSAVLTMERYGKKSLFPAGLADFEEEEIRKVAYDIGKALEYAHKNKILHRDIKLENIFYDEQRKRYKLGDFGIAKVTQDGMASTTAFTRGYVAPEVNRQTNVKYDNTADIYSFGMLLYVLMNGLKFPGSENYNVNVELQYQQGYVLPTPEHCYGKLFEIVRKMCSFDPDDRYQSMEQVMNELDGILGDEREHYRKEHKPASFVLGNVFLILGVAVKCRWLGIAFLSLAVVLLIQYWLLNIRNPQITEQYYKKNSYWSMISSLYGMTIVFGLTGAAFCIVWRIRERWLMRYRRNK